MNWKKTRLFSSPGFYRVGFLALTMLSAVAFSLSSLSARLFSKESLPALIQFQTTSVFLAFLFQNGLRSGLRNQYHLGRRRVVEAVEEKILTLAPWVSLPLSVIIITATHWEVFPAFAILHATLTLLIGLRIAQHRLPRAAIYSLLTFLSIAVPCAIIILRREPLVNDRIIIEVASILALFVLRLGRSPSPVSARALRQVIIKSLGLQLGSFTIYLLAYVFGQYVIMLSKENLTAAVAYTDVQLMCGIQALIFSRVYLFIEGAIVKKQKVYQLAVAMILWCILFAAGVFLVASLIHGPTLGLLYGALAFSLLGREPLGVLFQFMREKFRAESLAITLVVAGSLACCIFFEVKGRHAVLALFILSPTLISGFLGIRAYLNKNYFIRPEAAI